MPRSHYPWMYGSFYLSLDGIILGNPSESETLNAILACSKDWMKLTKTNCSEVLFESEATQAFFSIEAAFYGLTRWTSFIPKDFKAIPVEKSFYCQFDAGESSDGYRLYVLVYNHTVKLIYSNFLTEPKALVISKNEFDATVNVAINGLNQDFKVLKDLSNS